MNFFKILKKDALLLLKDNWLKSLGVVFVNLLIFIISYCVESFIYMMVNIDEYFQDISQLINSLVFGAPNNISLSSNLIIFVSASLAMTIIYLAISSIFKMGQTYWLFLSLHNKENPFSTIFFYFSSFKNIFKCWYLSLQIFFRKIFWSIIFFLPSVLVGIWSINATINQNKIHETFLIPLGYILFLFLSITSFIICIIFFRRYSLARYLLVSESDQTVRRSIKLSIKIMKNNKLSYLKLIFSFFPWFISCLFLFPFLFVFPYFLFSSNLFFRYITENYFNDKTANNISTKSEISELSNQSEQSSNLY